MRVLVHHVIDPVGDHLALTRSAEVVVEGLHGLGGEGRASAVKIPEQLLLLRVDGDHRIASRLILAPQARDVFELGIAIGVVAHRLLLAAPCGGPV